LFSGLDEPSPPLQSALLDQPRHRCS
jgi:hypothetical protein